MATIASDRLKHDQASDRVAVELSRLRAEVVALRRDLAHAKAEVIALTTARDVAIRVSVWGGRPKQLTAE